MRNNYVAALERHLGREATPEDIEKILQRLVKNATSRSTKQQDKAEIARTLDDAIASAREIEPVDERLIQETIQAYALEQREKADARENFRRNRRRFATVLGSAAILFGIGTGGVSLYRTISQRQEAQYVEAFKRLPTLATPENTSCTLAVDPTLTEWQKIMRDPNETTDKSMKKVYDNTIEGVRYRILSYEPGFFTELFTDTRGYLVVSSPDGSIEYSGHKFKRGSNPQVIQDPLDESIFLTCAGTVRVIYESKDAHTDLYHDGHVVRTTPGTKPYGPRAKTIVHTLNNIIDRNQ